MNQDEIEVRASLYTGNLPGTFLGRYATVHHFFLDNPTYAKIAVLPNKVGAGLFMFEPNENNKHLIEYRDNNNPKSCLIDTCYKMPYAKGYCLPHYRKFKTPDTYCTETSCTSKPYARGLCNRHYQVWRRSQR